LGDTHRRRRKNSRPLLKLLVGAAIVVFGFYCLVNTPFTKMGSRVALPARAEFRPERPRYPYSVIPGGVYSDQEMRGSLRADPVAARHYAGFFQGRVHPTVLSQSLVRYVSFRKNEQIYWTRKPVTLRAGETLLTDGNRFARARCGNQVSETPRLPVLAEEPSPETWEKPIEDPATGEVAASPPRFDPVHPPRVAPEIFLPENLVGLAVTSPPLNSGAPFLWAGGRTGGLIPFNPAPPSTGTLAVNVPDPRPNPPEARPVAELPTVIAPPAGIIPPPVIFFAGPHPAPRQPHLPPYAPPKLDVPGVPSNPPGPPPTDGPPPSDPPGPPLLPPPSDPPLPPVFPPIDPVPEPAAYLLVGFGLLLLVARRAVR
jgi:hypothetical protein